MDFLLVLSRTLMNISIADVVDILVVAFIFYKIYTLISRTRAEQVLKGVLLILILIPVSSILSLTVLNWLLNRTITIGVLSIVIIFQPEIRKALEHIGRTAFTDNKILSSEVEHRKAINEIVSAVESMANERVGALIVMEQITGLDDIITTGTKINGEISSSLIRTIFFEKTALHDGAVVIRGKSLVAAGCFLPLSNNNSISKTLGTRHRAGIGVTEVSDAISIIVSEETGNISLAMNGRLLRNYSKDSLENILVKIIEGNEKRASKNIRERVKTWRGAIKKKS